MILTEWELTRTTSSKIVLKMSASSAPLGVLDMEFYNRTTGAVEHLTARFTRLFTMLSPVNSWIPGGVPIPGVPKHVGWVLTKSFPFAISSLKGSYGALLAQDGTSGSIVTVYFSTFPPPLPMFIYGMIARAMIVPASQLIGKLSTSFIPFRVD